MKFHWATTQLWSNQNSFESSSLLTTSASAAFALWEQKSSHLTALFNAVVLKRIWLRILMVTNKYSWPNWDQRKSPDNREIRIIEVQLIEVRLYMQNKSLVEKSCKTTCCSFKNHKAEWITGVWKLLLLSKMLMALPKTEMTWLSWLHNF